MHSVPRPLIRSRRTSEDRLPGGEMLPLITLRHLRGGREVWCQPLVEVDDDLESKYLRAQRAELKFALSVPGRGMQNFRCGRDAYQ